MAKDCWLCNSVRDILGINGPELRQKAWRNLIARLKRDNKIAESEIVALEQHKDDEVWLRNKFKLWGD